MLTIGIPGRKEIVLSHVILDYNGTIALDGIIIESIRERLKHLHKYVDIHVITADTHGSAAEQCAQMPVEIKTFPVADVGIIKAEEARKLNGGVACVGNGYNDILMSDVCDLSICVIGQEGCCGRLPSHGDIITTSIESALDILLNPQRIRATLRN